MFFGRRGCTFGCGGLLLLCVALGLVSWFVILPRFSDELENELSRGISTAIAVDLSGNYSGEELRAGQTVEIPLARLNSELESNDDSTTFGFIDRNGRLILTMEYQGSTWELEFQPEVTDNGQLNLEPLTDGNWLENTVSDVLSGGFEKSINTWLDENNLVLTDVRLENGQVQLTVRGR